MFRFQAVVITYNFQKTLYSFFGNNMYYIKNG